MSIIERYMLRRIGILAFGALTVTTGIALTTQVLLRVDLLASTGQSLATIGQLALYLLPGMIAVALPFGVLIGILQTMRAMNQDSELVVLEASGTSIVQRARPALVIGAIGTLICLVISVWLEPLTGQKIRELLARASGDLLSSAIQSGSFKQVDQGLWIQIAEKLPNGGFGGIFVADNRDPANHFTYIAKTGSIVAEQGRTLLLVNDGQIQRKDVAQNTISFIKFDTYSLDAGTFSSPGTLSLTVRDRPTFYLMNPDVNDPQFQKFPERLRGELHRRFSDPLYALTLALIGIYVTVSARSHRHGAAAALTAAASLGFAVRSAGFVLAGNAGVSLVSILVLYAFPLAVTGLFSWLLMTGRRLRFIDEMAVYIPDVLSRIVLALRRERAAP
jgi:lipopolysaccharide export system permease protein